MANDFEQIIWDERLADEWRRLLAIALEEDLGEAGDCTTQSLVPATSQGMARVVARQQGIVCGMSAAEMAFVELDSELAFTTAASDGDRVAQRTELMSVAGAAGSLLTAERTVLNVIGRLSGIATLTRRYVDAVAGTGARIYDTRKTTPGWRRLEKYAVGCGGGHNHRTGLYDAVLIKDNHLAFCRDEAAAAVGPAEAVRRVRAWLDEREAKSGRDRSIVEIEVDTLEQLAEVVTAEPDVVLLDNMTTDELRRAVTMRDDSAAVVQLEASGGINLDTVAAVAATGVDRISVGALTHGAVSLDVAMDWG